MSCILNIETSTSVCSVALSHNGNIIYNKSSFEGPAHAALIGTYADEALKAMKENGLQLDAVAVSSGPGSYTGLRIGVSFAKGLCFGKDVPLISIPTLEILAVTALKQSEDRDLILCPMLDARRMEVYTSMYDSDLNVIQETNAAIIDEMSFEKELEAGKLCFFGNGAAKCKPVISHINAVFIDDIVPLAENMIVLADRAYAEKRFENVAYFEPFYLKEFQATVAKNKVLYQQS